MESSVLVIALTVLEMTGEALVLCHGEGGSPLLGGAAYCQILWSCGKQQSTAKS